MESAAGPGFFNDMIPGVTIAGESALSNIAWRDIGLDFDTGFAIGIGAEIGEDPSVAPGRGVVEFSDGCRRAGRSCFGVSAGFAQACAGRNECGLGWAQFAGWARCAG